MKVSIRLQNCASNSYEKKTRQMTAQSRFTSRVSTAPTCIQIVRSLVAKRKLMQNIFTYFSFSIVHTIFFYVYDGMNLAPK